jgi:uncharacterized protein YkwD
MSVHRLLTPLIASGLIIGVPLAGWPESGTPPPGMLPVLSAHNLYRAKHCVPPLSWSPALAISSQRWADRCIFDHQEESDDGENLFWGTAGAFSQEQVVESWYEEIAAYSFSAPRVNDETGHFTQIVWRASKRLGCAVARCRGNDFWVCRYAPAGNDEGRMTQNVSKPCR